MRISLPFLSVRITFNAVRRPLVLRWPQFTLGHLIVAVAIVALFMAWTEWLEKMRSSDRHQFAVALANQALNEPILANHYTELSRNVASSAAPWASGWAERLARNTVIFFVLLLLIAALDRWRGGRFFRLRTKAQS